MYARCLSKFPLRLLPSQETINNQIKIVWIKMSVEDCDIAFKSAIVDFYNRYTAASNISQCIDALMHADAYMYALMQWSLGASMHRCMLMHLPCCLSNVECRAPQVAVSYSKWRIKMFFVFVWIIVYESYYGKRSPREQWEMEDEAIEERGSVDKRW